LPRPRLNCIENCWTLARLLDTKIPQAYGALDESNRRAVREEVHARLAQYESADGKLTIGIEMLIGSGQA